VAAVVEPKVAVAAAVVMAALSMLHASTTPP